MKKIATLFLCLLASVSAFSEINPEKDFVLIPANPDFAFAKSLSKKGTGEKSPVAAAYRMAKFPVTNAEYFEFCKESGHRAPKYWKGGCFPDGKEKHPVLAVSVGDATAFCRWLEKKNPKWKFRLPSEAEWENAAAGPERFTFPWGNTDGVHLQGGKIVSAFNFNAVVASHFLKNSSSRSVTFFHPRSSRQGESVKLRELISVGERGQVRGWIDHRNHTGFVYTDLFRKLSEEGGFTTPVDYYKNGKSTYGCFDMAGNSWDWTSSEIVASNGAERGKTVNAIRGGSWYANKNSCRTDYRGEGRRPQGCYETRRLPPRRRTEVIFEFLCVFASALKKRTRRLAGTLFCAFLQVAHGVSAECFSADT